MNAANPDVVFHLAAQSLVLASYDDPVGTLQTNVLGTANLLDAIRTRGKPCVVIVVTSDKCYENRGWTDSYRETDPLGGHDLYSTSKAAAELVTTSYRRSFFGAGETIRVATARMLYRMKCNTVRPQDGVDAQASRKIDRPFQGIDQQQLAQAVAAY